MRQTSYALAALATLTLAGGAAQAQSMPSVGGQSSNQSGMMGNAMSQWSSSSNMLNGIVPGMSSTSTGNVAGILNYCVQQNVVNSTTATDTLGKLQGQSGVTSSSEYTAGQKGVLETANGKQFSLASAKTAVKQKVCNMVLQRAQNLL